MTSPYSVKRLGEIKQPGVEDLKLTVVLTLFRKVFLLSKEVRFISSI